MTRPWPRASLVAANKLDLPAASEQLDKFKQKVQAMGLEMWPLSAVSGQGVRPLLEELAKRLCAADDHQETEWDGFGQS
ncbi:hypothetical protein DFAR_1750007 [Desulfarculales bacterium]